MLRKMKSGQMLFKKRRKKYEYILRKQVKRVFDVLHLLCCTLLCKLCGNFMPVCNDYSDAFCKPDVKFMIYFSCTS